MKKTLTRRDFLRTAAAAPLVGLAISGEKLLEAGRQVGAQAAQSKARVVLIRDKNALKPDGNPDAQVIQKMLDEAVCTLLDEKDVVKAWKKIIRPDDVVGIKSNVWRYIPTTAEVEQAIKRRVMDAGVSSDKISIDDRGVLRDPVFQKATALINARPARTHHWSGLGTLIKNYIMFVPNPAAYHGDSCADLASIWNLPLVKDKTRLNILVMLTPLFHGIGPHHYSKEYTWEYRGMIVSLDPVAADVMGLKIIQAKRRQFFREDKPLQPSPHHIFLADTRHHLGVSSEDKIDLISLGWEEGRLI